MEALKFEYITFDKEKINQLLKEELKKFNKTIVVLDDDPTGTQTVNGIHVYCDWKKETLVKAFSRNDKMFFILTNSRSFSEEETTLVHKEIMKNILEITKDVIIYSRGDSTLRGHYPLETEILKDEFERKTKEKIEGEILCPIFIEGKRVTINKVHYIIENEKLLPVGESEFSKDKTFPYINSDLSKWCEEKTKGKYLADNITSIELDEIRKIDIESIVNKLKNIKEFNKIIVNGTNYYDLKVFTIALLKVLNLNKNFIMRGAASLVKVLSDCPEKKYLKSKDIINTQVENGGLIVVGSHVNKTSRQLEKLLETDIERIEFNQHLVFDKNKFEKEIERVKDKAQDYLKVGKDVVIFTKRERVDIPGGTKEEQLKIATKISDGLIDIVNKISIRPNFVIAKGGITSSDTATKGLKVKEALVLGQVTAGIPVWLTGNESKYPQMPYIIFPGNVGEDITLKNLYLMLKGEKNEV
ncbi:MAG: hydroxyacid dehydrogenase [Fusobacterium perfoetens]|uniref:four-carbon acid sugar kinase family protein n=1 Tax=Fusobacterium perfoetens TaxID=852 RepID=UPI0023EFEB35|nr:four-carbon acid sugar kinase family protein [Fusobacterium perfoetens]MCI6151630.1 hydroxyacid dehydrogenase [Fusobacterium perfoetens]MDY3237798.1 four-carbon acid sugar kinase family protein [Fusobacterium perfoetens]